MANMKLLMKLCDTVANYKLKKKEGEKNAKKKTQKKTKTLDSKSINNN